MNIKNILWLLVLLNLMFFGLILGTFHFQDKERSSKNLIASPKNIDLSKKPNELETNLNIKSCIEISGFNTETSLEFENLISRIPLPYSPKKILIQAPKSNIVFIPPNDVENNSNLNIKKLNKLGFRDVIVIKDNTKRNGGISIGVFRKKESAEKQLNSLWLAGINEALIDEYPINSSVYSYQIDKVDSQVLPSLKSLLSKFEGTKQSDCFEKN